MQRACAHAKKKQEHVLTKHDSDAEIFSELRENGSDLAKYVSKEISNFIVMASDVNYWAFEAEVEGKKLNASDVKHICSQGHIYGSIFQALPQVTPQVAPPQKKKVPQVAPPQKKKVPQVAPPQKKKAPQVAPPKKKEALRSRRPKRRRLLRSRHPKRRRLSRPPQIRRPPDAPF